MMDDINNSDAHNDAPEAYEQIMDAIVTQKLAPSQKVSENIFCDMFGISRSIARNLIERLTAKHFLISVSPRITLVAPLTLLEIKQNFTLRKMLLPEISTLAARNIDFDAMQNLNKKIQNMLPIQDDHSALQILKHHKQLNILICAQAGYPLMLDWAQQLEDTAMRINWLYIKITKSFYYSKEQLDMSFSVLKNDDPARIRQIMHDIIAQTEERILNTIFSHEQFYTQDLKI